ncbi:MAG: hypothetical protein ACTSYA_10045 [Candidatus Kariarchaeaceae archaeon]
MKDDIRHIFRAYDIRGKFNDELTPEAMTRIGSAYGTFCRKKGFDEVVVGGDVRGSTECLINALISGITSTGISVSVISRSPLGPVLFNAWYLKKGASAFVTASHLPPEFNGVKFYFGDGVGFSTEQNEEVYSLFYKEDEWVKVNYDEVGKVEYIDAFEKYYNHVTENFKVPKMKVVIDCGNGAASLVFPQLYENLGLEVKTIFGEPDPSFPNRPSEPNEKTLTRLTEVVQEEKADFGVGFDGDGDRCVLVDNMGRVVSGDVTGVLLGKSLAPKKGSEVLINVECSSLIKTELEKDGLIVSYIPVGHATLTYEAAKRKAVLGIESSGHMVIPSIFPFDDALIVPLVVAKLIGEKSLAKLADEIPTFHKARYDLITDDKIKFKVMEIIVERIKETKFKKITTMDGVRVDTESGWALVRASNTSAKIRITVESADKTEFNELSEFFKQMVNKVKEEITN